MKTQTRIEKLEAEVKTLFGHIPDIYDVNRNGDYEVVVVEILELESVGPIFMTLNEVFSEKVYSHVLVPPKLRGLLYAKDVFLMSIGRVGDVWHVLAMSSRYTEDNFEEDGEFDDNYL